VIEAERSLVSRRAGKEWRAATLKKRLLREVGPFPLPTTGAGVAAMTQSFAGQTPFDAAFLFTVGVLRILTVRSGRGSGRERANSCKMLKTALSSVHHLRDLSSGGGNLLIRPATLKLFDALDPDMIASYFVGCKSPAFVVVWRVCSRVQPVRMFVVAAKLVCVDPTQHSICPSHAAKPQPQVRSNSWVARSNTCTSRRVRLLPITMCCIARCLPHCRRSAESAPFE
jgi:hypothetical protein